MYKFIVHIGDTVVRQIVGLAGAVMGQTEFSVGTGAQSAK